MSETTPSLLAATPILRMFDVPSAKTFYIDYLGFKLDWEHRYEPDLPLYMQVSSGECVLHLSEHYGDGTPGSAIRIEVRGLEAFHARLSEKSFPYSRPGLDAEGDELTVWDPSGNRIVFFERRTKGAEGGENGDDVASP